MAVAGLKKATIILERSRQNGCPYFILEVPGGYLNSNGVVEYGGFKAKRFYRDGHLYDDAKDFALSYGYDAVYPGFWWFSLVRVVFNLEEHPIIANVIGILIPIAAAVFLLSLF